jgi:hypothetical protein
MTQPSRLSRQPFTVTRHREEAKHKADVNPLQGDAHPLPTRRRNMKSLLRSLSIASLLTGCAVSVPAATTTLTGTISDSMCGASHAKMTSSHPGLTDRACTQACIKAGAKYVFVSDGKVYNIANQNFANLDRNAGESVRLTGDVSGETITVSKIAMEKK